MPYKNNILIYSIASVITIVMMKCTLSRRKYAAQQKRKRRTWCRNWLNARHQGKGVLTMLNKEFLLEDLDSYSNFLRLSNDQFEYLLSLVENKIRKQDTIMRECIPARSRLEITLRFLATGETYRSMMYSTRVHETTISRIIVEVCTAIINVLKPLYLQTPNKAENWKKIAEEFNQLWQFPLCLGALDGRHITFRAPISSGSYFHNYKGNNSIVLLGLVDAKYRFTYINIGINGRISDGGVFRNSKLSEAIYNNTLNFPEPELLPGLTEKLPYVIVADDAFPLSHHLMKPYSQRGLDPARRIYNYRLSRARRVVENAFGILANRFRVLLNPINLSVEKVQLITYTCVLLHNFLATENQKAYVEVEEDMQQLRYLGNQGGNRTSNDTRHIRDLFKCFFNGNSGSVYWQNTAINNFNM